MAPPVLDPLWTQDSPMSSLILSTTWDIISSNEGQQLGFSLQSKNQGRAHEYVELIALLHLSIKLFICLSVCLSVSLRTDKDLEIREGIGKGREPHPESQGGFGGGAAPRRIEIY